MQNYLNEKKLLDLLQINNSTFPIGGFSHSFGLETFIRENIITDANSLKKWIKKYLNHNFLYFDLLAIREVYETVKINDFNKLQRIDNLISCSGLSKESRNAAIKIANQMIKIYVEIFQNNKYILEYQKMIKDKVCYGHPAVAYSLLCIDLNIDIKDCLYSYIYTTISNLIQNCVRAIPLGQIEGQKLIYNIKQDFYKLYDAVFKLNFEKEFCKNFPGFEIKQMNHEFIFVRLFMS